MITVPIAEQSIIQMQIDIMSFPFIVKGNNNKREGNCGWKIREMDRFQ